MSIASTISSRIGFSLGVLATVAISVNTQLAHAQSSVSPQTSKLVLEQEKLRPLTFEERSKVNYDAYILGPGDGVQIELLDIPELSGRFTIGPDGTLYLPRLRALYVEGLTVDELRKFLTDQFSTYVRDPQVYVRPFKYRPVRIYVGGEVRRPGFYTLSGNTNLTSLSNEAEANQFNAGTTTDLYSDISQSSNRAFSGVSSGGVNTFAAVFPTVFDAIRAANGITPFSNLSSVKVTRRRAQGLGGGKIRTDLNFLSLITEGNQSQNIRLVDGDVISVDKSKTVLRDQLLQAGQTNLNPLYLNVFVSGRVMTPGKVTVPQGALLNQAITLAGGPKLIRGKVEFIRFSQTGEVIRRTFPYNPNAAGSTPNNPVLMAGDLISILDSPISMTTTVLNELTAPMLGIYSAYSIFTIFN